jgi:hypothetical protein
MEQQDRDLELREKQLSQQAQQGAQQQQAKKKSNASRLAS